MSPCLLTSACNVSHDDLEQENASTDMKQRGFAFSFAQHLVKSSTLSPLSPSTTVSWRFRKPLLRTHLPGSSRKSGLSTRRTINKL